jgi:hypothetical protein
VELFYDFFVFLKRRLPPGIDDPITLGSLVTMAIALFGHLKAPQYFGYTLLGSTWLHGHLTMHGPVGDYGAPPYGSAHYWFEGPLPALFMMPLLLLGGIWGNQSILATILAGLVMGTAWKLAWDMGLSAPARAWLCAFLFLGTDVFWGAMRADTLHIAYLCSLLFTLLVLLEVWGKRRGWLVAIYAGCAMQSHLGSGLAVPIYAAMLWGEPDAMRGRRLWSFAAVFFPCMLLRIGYAALAEPGFPALPAAEQAFGLRTLVGLAWTSPAFALALLAPASRLRTLLWGAVGLTLMPLLVCAQGDIPGLGVRSVVDFEPYLFMLALLATRAGVPAWGLALCTYSMFVGVWGGWQWSVFDRPNW